MNKIDFIKGAVVIIIGLIISINLIAGVYAVPKIEPYVNDFANVLTSEQISSLNLLIDEIEQNTTWEIAIVSVPNTEGMDRLEYANKIGDENGVGKLDKDNGLVVLWSEGEDRGLAIASGRYSESIFNDAKLARILRAARPYFDNQTYYEGYLNITLELKQEIVAPTNETNTDAPTNDFPIFFVIIIAIIFGAMIIIPIIKNSDSDSSYSSSSYGRSSGSSSGSSGGFSSGSFSGSGSFGGGGAKA